MFQTTYQSITIYFQLTLQICVLAGAVLFIFCGVSVAGCAMLLPATAAGVALAVHVAHLAAADKQVQVMIMRDLEMAK